MTPEAVIDKYLEVAGNRPVDRSLFLRLLGTDADLLGRWLGLLRCPVDVGTLGDALDRLDEPTFVRLACSQAWAGLPVSGSARLSMDQWRGVLRAALLGESLAEHLGTVDPESTRWRLLLSASGVNLPHDQAMSELLAFRGARPELLEDAGLEFRLYAVVDALEIADEAAAGNLAKILLGLESYEFHDLLGTADARLEALLAELGLAGELDTDWAERVWIRQQVNLLGLLFADCESFEAVEVAHGLASRSLFGYEPRLLVVNPAEDTLEPIDGDGMSIALASRTSTVAASLRDGHPRTLIDSPELAVADRQLLWRMDVSEGACRPIRAGERLLGALIFSQDEDMDTEFAMTVYGDELTGWIVRASAQAEPAKGALVRYREREEKRLRELVHEANNPLSVVYNYLHILELRLQHEPSAIEQLRMIGEELRRTSEIIRRARELPPVEEPESAGSVEIGEVDLSRLAGHVFELHRGYAADRDVRIDQEAGTGGVVVASDEGRLIQILTNLVRNAIEAAPGGSVTIRTLGGVFREGIEGVELSVADTGPGLPREVLEHLGDPKESAKGGEHAGLGLHIVHRLVDELKARIDVRTGPAIGTTFTVFLPLRQPG